MTVYNHGKTQSSFIPSPQMSCLDGPVLRKGWWKGLGLRESVNEGIFFHFVVMKMEALMLLGWFGCLVIGLGSKD